MSRTLDRQAAEILRAAIAAGDKSVDVYLDRERLVVVKVKDGVCTPADLAAEQVEEDVERFAEIPVVTRTDEYLLMQEFVEERDEPRVTALLDSRAGANERFLKRLVERAPDALADWQAHLAAHMDEVLVDWLAELGVEVTAAP